ncbi:hypothetical protein V6Z90_007148 [Aspergillus fumigatus]
MALVEEKTKSEPASLPMKSNSLSQSSLEGGQFDINEKALLRKLDYRLLPPLTILYLLSFLDRSNVGNARLEGMAADIGMTGNMYLTGLTLYFIGYVAFEVPSNIVLKRTTPRIWLPTLTLLWGIVATLLGVVQNYAGYLTSRTGLVTVVMSIVAYFWVYNYPATAEFLTDKERAFIQFRLKNDSDATRDEKFSWTAVFEAFKDVKVWLYGLCFHTMSLPLYTLSLFMPTIIKELGYSAAKAQLLTVPPYALGFILTIIVAILSERTRRRAPFIIGSTTFACIGYILLLTSKRASVCYAGVFFAAGGIYPSVAIVLSWPANNVSGQTKRAIANAMQISIGNLGAVMGTQLYRTESSPRYYVGHGFALGYLLANIAVVSVLWAVLNRENIDKAKQREAKGITAIIGDIGDAGGDFQGDRDSRWIFQT